MNPIQQVRSWLEQRRIRATMRSFAGGGAVPAAPVLSGTFVTPETAIGLTAVYCALNVISGDVASLPRHVYKTLDGGGLTIERDHPAEWLIGVGDPNEEMGRFRYVQAEMGHVLGRGNGYSEIVRKNGFPTALEPLHPVKTLPKRTKSGRLYYLLDNKETLKPEDVVHLAGMGFDGLSGYSAITLCRQSLGVTIATEQFGAAFFGNGAIPAGVLKHPRRLGEAAMSNLRKTINQVHQGSQSAHNLLILEEGMDYMDRGIIPGGLPVHCRPGLRRTRGRRGSFGCRRTSSAIIPRLISRTWRKATSTISRPRSCPGSPWWTTKIPGSF